MPRGGGGSYNWVSPGAAALRAFSDSLDTALKDREREARQARLDAIEDARIQRDVAEHQQRMKYADVNAAALAEERQDQNVIRDLTIAATERTRDLGNMRRGDVMTPAMVAKYAQDAEQDAPTQGAHLGVDEAGVDQYEVVPGRFTYRGTVKEREEQAKRAGFQRVFDQNPELLKAPGLKQAWQAAIETGDFSLVEEAFKAFVKPPDAITPGSMADYTTASPERQALLRRYREEYRLDPPPQLIQYYPLTGGPATFQGGQINPLAPPAGMSYGLPPDTAEPWRNVIQGLTKDLERDKKIQTEQFYGQLVQSGNAREAARNITNSMIQNEDATITGQVRGREGLLKALSDIRGTLDEMKQAGVPTNWIVGNVEELANKLGTTQNPTYAALGTRLKAMMQNYRNSKSGLAFTLSENKEYQQMMPSLIADWDLNIARIDGLERAVNTEDRAFWEGRLGEHTDMVLAARRGQATTPIRSAPSGGNGSGGPVSPTRAEELRRRLNP